MPLFSSTQPSLRARILPRFPAQVLAGTGITITKSGGTYVFAVAPYSNIPINALANINSDTLLGRDTIGVGPPESLTVGGGIGFTGAGGIQLQANQRIRPLFVQFYKGGAVLAIGDKVDFFVPISGTITRATMLADQSGSVVVDIWKNTYANYPPVVGNTITAAALPTISAALKYQDSILTGWSTTLTAGDTLRFNVNSVTSITRLVVSLDVVTV